MRFRACSLCVSLFNFFPSGGMPAPSAFPSFYNSGDRRDGFYLLPQVASSQFSTTDNALDFNHFHSICSFEIPHNLLQVSVVARAEGVIAWPPVT
jgi:hypothetical protein